MSKYMDGLDGRGEIPTLDELMKLSTWEVYRHIGLQNVPFGLRVAELLEVERVKSNRTSFTILHWLLGLPDSEARELMLNSVRTIQEK